MEISVVVPSHDRPLRLRWLLNKLEEQTLADDQWELIVAHDSRGPATDELLRTHPLLHRVASQVIRLPPGSAPPGRNRNAGWRAAHAPVVLFTDDDCLPPPRWLDSALAAARRYPGAVVQGLTYPDPVESRVIGRHAPYVHSQWILPPLPWGQACNIIYPRTVLEATGGFPEDMYVGEDTALLERAKALGVPYEGALDCVNYHAVKELSLPELITGAWRWRDLPLLVARHPRIRQNLPVYIFWRRAHAMLPLAALGWIEMRRNRFAVLLTLPYLIHALPTKHGPHPRGRIRALFELPGWTAQCVVEMVGLAWGSVKHRKLLL